MNAPDPIANTIREEVADGLRKKIAERKAEIQHDEARTEALREACENGDFDPDSYTYSIHRPPTSFVAPCKCVARKEKQCDGDSVWTDWVWNDSKCEEEL